MASFTVTSPGVLAIGIVLCLLGVVVAVRASKLGAAAPWLAIALLSIGAATIAGWALG